MAEASWITREYALGISVAAYSYLHAIGVPPPDNVFSSPYEVQELRGDLTWQSAGIRTVTWQWGNITHDQMSRLLVCIFTSETDVSASGYVRTDVRNAWLGGGAEFADYQCEAKRPKLDGQDGQPAPSATTLYRQAKLVFILV